MDSEAMHQHYFHNPDQPHKPDPKLMKLKALLEAKEIYSFSVASEYLKLAREALLEIIGKCGEDIAKNELYIEHIATSKHDEQSKIERTNQAKRWNTHIKQRKKIAEIILENWEDLR